MTKVVKERTLGIAGDGLIKDIVKFSNENPFSPENIETIFKYINIAKEIIVDANNHNLTNYENR